MTDGANRGGRGYGNLYTPHAGPMIISLQRESGLANRTVVLTGHQVRALRIALIAGAVALVIGALSWVWLASQAARVPYLTSRVAHLQREARRVDTLQNKLVELEERFEQVQRMFGGASVREPPTPSAPVAPVKVSGPHKATVATQ